MEISDLVRSVLEIGFGIFFVIGAIFNSLYTIRNGEEFYGSFAEKALLPLSGKLVKNVVIPRNRIFTISLIAFQLIVAAFILSRGALAGPALIAAGLFAFGAAWVSNTGGMIANLVMAVILIYLGVSHGRV